MGVDLAVYRARVGQFVPRPVKGIVSNTEYLCKAIASVRGDLTPDKWNTKGAVTFIDLLLRAQGIEPNPGPGKKGQLSFADKQTDDNDDINITLDSNADPSSADRISQFMECLLPATNPTDTAISQASESAVAMPGHSGAIAHSTSGLQVEINYVDERKHYEHTHVENMKVKHAENVSTGDQTIIHAAPPTANENDGNPKPKKEMENEGIKKGSKRIAPEAAPTDNEIDDNPKPKKGKKDGEIKTSSKRIAPEGHPIGNEDDDIPKSKKKKEEEAIKKSPKRIALEENAETMLKRHIEETANVLVTRTGAITAAVKRLKDYNMVVIAGVTGEGKTTLGREICKQLRDGTLDKDIKPKTPVIMTVPQDWSDVVNDKDDIVVFVDDIFGKTNYQTGLLNGWKPLFDRILHCLHEKNVCLVVTSRTHILKDASRESGVLIDMISDHILSQKKTVDLTDDQKLTSEERSAIYKNYSNQRNTDHDVVTFFAVHESPSNISIGFAQICKLFFTNDTFYEKGGQFFQNPDRMLTEEIEKMRLTEPHKYFALVHCFLNDQTIDSRKLNPLNMPTEDYNTLKVYAEVCGVPRTDNVLTLLKNGLAALDRTYLTRRNTMFMFGHQSIADSVSLVFGNEHPEITLEKCSDRVILELLDVSEADQTERGTLHVPPDCFKLLAKRMCKMIMEGNIYDRITLESFSRFRNQKLADCLFEYITTRGDTRRFLRAQCSSNPSSSKSLLESCANNVYFLRAFFKFKVDEFIVKEHGILVFIKTLQKTLQLSLEYKNSTCLSVLLANGAFFTKKCLHTAIGSKDVTLTEFVLSQNTWTHSEVSEHIKDDTPDQLRDILKRGTNMCKVELIRNQYLKQKTYINTKARNLQDISTKDMTTAAEAMDFDTLHAIFQNPELKEHYNRLMEIILASKHKRLSDAIAIKRISGQIEGTVVQYALHRCNLDMFRFLLYSSNTNEAQMNAMLSEAIHLNKTDYIDVLTKAGGQPSLNDFVGKAGTICMDVECVVETIMKAASWTQEQLDGALDAAVCSGAHATMKVLIEGGARFAQDALVNVSKRYYDLQPPQQVVPVTVAWVFAEHKWSQRQITDAITAAIESGFLTTVYFFKKKGGIFRSDALLAAVRRPHDSLTIVKFVRRSEEWSVEQLNDALHQAMVLCRPDVVVYLTSSQKGFPATALFNDSSLKNVLRWHVERHVQEKLIKYIFKARKWAPVLIDDAIQLACETKGRAVLAFLAIAETRSETLTRKVLLKLEEIEKEKKGTIRELKSKGMDDDLALVLNKEIRQGCTDIVEHLICELKISCDDDSLSNAMDNTENYQSYDRLKMVRLVRESQDWSDELLTKALDKAARLGYTEVIFYLHDHGAMFSDNSLEYAIVDKTVGYDTYALVVYMMKSRQYKKDQMDIALEKSLQIGHYQLMTMFHEEGAEFAENSLQNAIHKNWTASDRLPAVKFVLQARHWDADEKNDALLRSVKFGDISVIAHLLKCGGKLSERCLSAIFERKCKPSHRLCIVRLLLSSSGSLSRDLLEEAVEKARLLSESKLETYIQHCIK